MMYISTKIYVAWWQILMHKSMIKPRSFSVVTLLLHRTINIIIKFARKKLPAYFYLSTIINVQ